jgi:hypothetical protein
VVEFVGRPSKKSREERRKKTAGQRDVGSTSVGLVIGRHGYSVKYNNLFTINGPLRQDSTYASWTGSSSRGILVSSVINVILSCLNSLFII